MADADSKACRVCGLVLPLSSFGPRKASRDGLQTRCRKCTAEYAIQRYHREKKLTPQSPTVLCLHCGKPFYRPVMNPPRGNVRHCSFECRFWSKVDKSGGEKACWPWTAGGSHGYGTVTHGGKNLVSSRVAYELTKGPIPDGMLACHSCDNPLCCNPAHIFVGAHQDNMDDRMAKGRYYVKTTRSDRAEQARKFMTGKTRPPEVREKMRAALENWRRRKTHEKQ